MAEKEPKINIGIFGIGMVGGALQKYFEGKSNYKLFVYDKGNNIGTVKEVVVNSDFIYICVPTPHTDEDGCDISIVETVVKQIDEMKTDRLKGVIIKSTVLPGTTEELQKKHPDLKMLFVPEFLTEITADQDMGYPDRQIVGYTDQSYNVVKDVLQQLPLAPYERMIPATEAEMIKYFGNTWFATKVGFANQIYDLCERLNISYDIVMSGASADKRIGRTHLKVWHKGYRGYGNLKVSKCLPKDTKALIKFGKDMNVEMSLLKTVDEYNTKLWELYGDEGKVVEDKDTEFTSGGDLVPKK